MQEMGVPVLAQLRQILNASVETRSEETIARVVETVFDHQEPKMRIVMMATLIAGMVAPQAVKLRLGQTTFAEEAH